MVVKRRQRLSSPWGVARPGVAGGAADPAPCPLCGRPMSEPAALDAHHLVPRSRGGREAFPIHRVCHRKIHATLTEGELAREFSSWEALRAHPEIAAFVAWVGRRPPGFVDASAKTRRLRRRSGG